MATHWVTHKGVSTHVYYETTTSSRGPHPCAWACTVCHTGGLEATGVQARAFAKHHAAQSHNFPKRCMHMGKDGIPCANASHGTGNLCKDHSGVYTRKTERKE